MFDPGTVSGGIESSTCKRKKVKAAEDFFEKSEGEDGQENEQEHQDQLWGYL